MFHEINARLHIISLSRSLRKFIVEVTAAAAAFFFRRLSCCCCGFKFIFRRERNSCAFDLAR